jgi:hypothetical protein
MPLTPTLELTRCVWQAPGGQVERGEPLASLPGKLWGSYLLPCLTVGEALDLSESSKALLSVVRANLEELGGVNWRRVRDVLARFPNAKALSLQGAHAGFPSVPLEFLQNFISPGPRAGPSFWAEALAAQCFGLALELRRLAQALHELGGGLTEIRSDPAGADVAALVVMAALKVRCQLSVGRLDLHVRDGSLLSRL